MEYIFYYAQDPNREPIGRVKANNKSQAEELFANKKQLPLSKFNSIFRVEKDE